MDKNIRPHEVKLAEYIVGKEGGNVSTISYERLSDRDYDVEVSYAGKLCMVAGWLPLCAIRSLINWTAYARFTDYPEMVEQGDWSGVRDSSTEKLWGLFAQVPMPK